MMFGSQRCQITTRLAGQLTLVHFSRTQKTLYILNALILETLAKCTKLYNIETLTWKISSVCYYMYLKWNRWDCDQHWLIRDQSVTHYRHATGGMRFTADSRSAGRTGNRKYHPWVSDFNCRVFNVVLFLTSQLCLQIVFNVREKVCNNRKDYYYSTPNRTLWIHLCPE